MKLLSQVSKTHKQEVRSLQAELDEEREKFVKSYKSLEEVNKDALSKLDNERRNLKDQRKFWDSQLEDARVAISGNSQEFSNNLKRLREENLELSSKVSELTQKIQVQVPQPVQLNLDELKSFVGKLVRETDQAKQDKNLNDCKLDYEMRIVSKG